MMHCYKPHSLMEAECAGWGDVMPCDDLFQLVVSSIELDTTQTEEPCTKRALNARPVVGAVRPHRFGCLRHPRPFRLEQRERANNAKRANPSRWTPEALPKA